MSAKPRIVCIGEAADQGVKLLEELGEKCDLVHVSNPLTYSRDTSSQQISGVYLAAQTDGDPIERIVRNEQILQAMPDGVVLLNAENRVEWANRCLTEWARGAPVLGQSFYTLFGKIEILGPDFCPFHTALHRGRPTSSTLKCSDNRHFQVHAAPVETADGPMRHLVVTVRDVTKEVLQQQKLEAIHKAGMELADLTAEEVFHLSVEERIELLKSNILHYTKDLLNFDVVEIRLLEQGTGRLVPLLSLGIEPEAADRPLHARLRDNGVTGFVAATGKSYLCEDTLQDPLYIEGCRGAKSSLTVPLSLHDQVIGTFNVESPEPHAFSESDLQFLEIFSRDVASALNTWELLVAQQVNTAQASVEAIHREVALPVDEILNDAVNIMERYIGHEPSVEQRLHRILRNARDIKQLIHKVGQEMTPAEAVPNVPQPPSHPALSGRRVLVVDSDEGVRSAAHHLLDRLGCVVETAQGGNEAIFMVRSCGPAEEYDVVIADIRLPDMNGFEFFVKLRDVSPKLSVVLMTGFGYDPGHAIVKARQEGLPAHAVLHKPFRLDQLIQTVECVLGVEPAGA
ncbi:MAG: response regulator [Planctomycetota bacterium]|nr:response regulator [Planctomycetota bacterium]